VVRVKICGITNLEDALAAAEAGCDAVGFIFYKKSPRYIAPIKAKEIIRKLPKGVIKIGVFVNAAEDTIRDAARLCHLDMLQFHGDETPEFCRRFKGCKIIKSFRVKDKFDPEAVAGYKVFAYLFDTFSKGRFGGTGSVFNWKLIDDLNLKQPVFVSGGLSRRNVSGAIKLIRPSWVDASTSLEERPGKKDHKEIRRFIAAAKGS